jgi:hypothetical protein
MIQMNRFKLLVCGLSLSAGVSAAGFDLKPEDVIRSHLERVGPAAARAARQNSVAEGQAEIKFLVFGSGSTTGGALFYSQGNKQRLTLTFDSQQYRGEDIVFDGEKFSVAYADTRSYSPLGQFLHTFNGIIKEGLLGSALSTAWPLFEPSVRGAKIQYAGLETAGEEKRHRLDYRMRRGGGDVTISLFFDEKNFRHVRTDYRVRLPAPLNRSMRDTSSTETHYRLIETFEEFEPVAGLDLPRRWKLRFSISGSSALEWEWDIRFKSVTTNQPIG